MRLSFPETGSPKGSARFLRSAIFAFVYFVCFVGFPLLCRAQGPSWWVSRGVIDTNSAVKDYAPANIGQLKWFATNAADELEANLPGGAGSNVFNLVSGFVATGNFLAVNLGQLKYVAQPFCDRLIEEGYTNGCPWTSATADDADFAPANIGQIKRAFDFDLSFDEDNDGMPDWWEVRYGVDQTSAALRCWYRMEETNGTVIVDSSGHNHTGTLSGTTADLSSSAGVFGQALCFDGTDDFIHVSNDDMINPTGEVTITAWVRHDPWTMPWGWVAGKTGGSTNKGWGLRIQNVAQWGWPVVFTRNLDITCSTNLATGVWYFVAGSIDRTNMSLFLDGNCEGTMTWDPTNICNDFAFTIGNNAEGSGPFRGLIDDVRMYSPALSSNALRRFHDADGDGLSNVEEYQAKCSPTNVDTDADGLVDCCDGVVSTNSCTSGVDRDGDGFVDAESDYGTDPVSSDTDGDQMPDGWEVRYTLNPLVNDAGADPDSDQLTNLQEYGVGTDPKCSDTDLDGLPDNVDAYPIAYDTTPPVFTITYPTNGMVIP